MLGRKCPCCHEDRLCSVREAEAVFRTSDWGSTQMMEDADVVCSYCHAVRVDGEWLRMESVRSRAYHLSQNGGTKDANDYREILTRGIETGRSRDRPTADDAEGW